jgi:hypothetical protein
MHEYRYKNQKKCSQSHHYSPWGTVIFKRYNLNHIFTSIKNFLLLISIRVFAPGTVTYMAGNEFVYSTELSAYFINQYGAQSLDFMLAITHDLNNSDQIKNPQQ